jgi:hypothetical protein
MLMKLFLAGLPRKMNSIRRDGADDGEIRASPILSLSMSRVALEEPPRDLF